MSDTPNLYGFATKELAQDATIAYIMAWADPKYMQSHKRLHALGTELLRALLGTQRRELPTIETLCVETQVHRIDIVVRINADNNSNGIILIVEDKVNTKERSNQIEDYVRTAKEEYQGQYRELVPVYLKTGNESQTTLPEQEKCGRFLRPQLLGVLDRFKDTGNDIVEDFRAHLQRREDVTNRWSRIPYVCWQGRQREGFYTALEKEFAVWRSGWGYTSNASGGFLCWWGGVEKIGIGHEQADLYLQIHDATRLTIRVGSGDAMDRVDVRFLYQVLNVLKHAKANSFDDFQISKVRRFRGGDTAAVVDVKFGGQCTWLAADANRIVDLGACVERLYRVHDLIRRVAAILTEDMLLEKS